MTGNYFNASAVETAPGLASTLGSFALQAATVAWAVASVLPAMGRRKRHVQAREAEDEWLGMREVALKMMDDVDGSACLPLALCHATSLPRYRQTENHHAIINLLSPFPAAPVAWPEINTPSAKYQYAAFVGQWAGLAGAHDQCRRVFPTCAMAPADVISLLLNWKLPCSGNGNNDGDNNNIKV